MLDAEHAAIVEAVVSVLRGAGWTVLTEATFALGGDRGSVDVLAWHEATAQLLVVEVKSALADAQDTLSKLDRKRRLAVRIAPAAWRVRSVSSLLVIGETRTNRRRVAALGETFSAAYPDRNVVVRRFLRAPGPRPLHGLLFLTANTHLTARHRVRRS